MHVRVVRVADPDDDLTNAALDPRTRLSEIRRRAALSDARTLRGLHAIGTSLGLGAAILINLFDPRVITLGGYFAVLGDLLMPAMEAELDRRAVLPARGGCRWPVMHGRGSAGGSTSIASSGSSRRRPGAPIACPSVRYTRQRCGATCTASSATWAIC